MSKQSVITALKVVPQ